MRIISVNVGLPRDFEWRGRTVRTSIWKAPVEGRVCARRLNLDGDAQSDLSVHGGPEKAIYVYPSEHYAFWQGQLQGFDLPWGAFGENFTTEGLTESEVLVGDRIRAGSAEFAVTQPRMPCFKLGIRFGRDRMVKDFLQSGRTGFYLAVLSEGDVGAGDAVEFIERDADGLSIADVAALYARDSDNQELLRRAAGTPALPEGWRTYFRNRLWKADS